MHLVYDDRTLYNTEVLWQEWLHLLVWHMEWTLSGENAKTQR